MTEWGLVTGFPGWLTEHLFRRLDGGHAPDDWARPLAARRWRALVAPGTAPARIPPGLDEIVEGDIRDPEAAARALVGAGLVLHAAGLIHPRRIRELYEVNAGGTRCLAAAAASAGAARFVLISSNAAAGFAHPDRPLHEADPPRPASHYGRSKLLAEQALWEELANTSTEGVVLRPTTFYGPHFPPRQLRAFQLARSGRPPVIGSGRNSVSMIYIDDLIEAVGRAMTRPVAAGGTYFVADARSYQWQEVFLAMAAAQGVEARVRRLPGLIAPACGLADRLLASAGRYAMMVHVAGEARQHMACSINRLRHELDFTPSVGLERGMQRAVDWARAEGWL